MKLIGLLSVATFISAASSLQCKKCRGNGTAIKCEEDCEGDYCVVWKWATLGGEKIRQGCISGVANVKVGCRSNQVGASLCICKDFAGCNTLHRSPSTVPVLPVVRLPSVKCLSLVHLHLPKTSHKDDAPLRINPSHTSCHSDYCHFTRSETLRELTDTTPPPSGPANLSVSLCSPYAEYEFDVRLWSSPELPRGLEPNFCYRIRTERNRAETSCICSTNDCNRMLPQTRDGPYQCYAVRSSNVSNKVDGQSLCFGDYCFIRRHADGTFSKGCISIHPIGNHVSTLQAGNRTVLDESQWLCKTQLCNLDLDRVSKSVRPRIIPSTPAPVTNGHFLFPYPVIYLLIILISFH